MSDPYLHDDGPAIVRLCRALRGCSQQALAEAAGLDPSQVSRHETGEHDPSAETLRRIAGAAGLPLPFARQVVAAARALASSRSPRWAAGKSAAEPAAWVEEVARRVSVAAEPTLAELAALLSGTEEPESALDSTWATFELASERAREAFLGHAPRFRNLAFFERLCVESARLASASPTGALDLARKALGLARQVSGSVQERRCREGFAWAFVGNAQRAAQDLRGAARAFAPVATLYDPKVAAAIGLREPWRPFDLEASLRRDQRDFPAALALLDRAISVRGSRGATAALLVKKAFCLEQMGDLRAALGVLVEAKPVADREGDLRLQFGIRLMSATSLRDLGQLREARQLMPDVRRLASSLGEIDRIRVDWLEGRLAASGDGGDRSEALDLLARAKEGFLRHGLAGDAALVSLELAILHLESGRTAEVRALAEEIVAILDALGVARETLAAVRLFVEAARRETATAEQARAALSKLKGGRE